MSCLNTFKKRKKSLRQKHISQSPRRHTSNFFGTCQKGFSQHSKGQKKKNVQVSSMTRLNEHSPLIMPGCIMSPRHTFTNKQHCWSVNIHYYYADSLRYSTTATPQLGWHAGYRETPEHIRRLTKQWSLDFATYIVCMCSKVRSL